MDIGGDGRVIVEKTDEYLSEVIADLEDKIILLQNDADELLNQTGELWSLLHDVVKATRTSGELSSPRVFAEYDAMCAEYGETPRQARVGGE